MSPLMSSNWKLDLVQSKKEWRLLMSDWQWKNKIKKRDGYVCRKCGFDKNLHVHHILPKDKYPYEQNYPPNGLTLCGNCHSLLKDKEEQTDLRGFLSDDQEIDEQLKYLSENASLVNKSQQILLAGNKSQRINRLVKDKFLRANDLSDRGEYKEAIALYKDALAYYYRGQANAELGQHDAAQIDYDTADWLSPRVRYDVLLREIFGYKINEPIISVDEFIA